MKKDKLLTLGEAMISGKPFRHIALRPRSSNHPEIWFKIHDDKNFLVIGPDDIVPFADVIAEHWLLQHAYELKETAPNQGEGV